LIRIAKKMPEIELVQKFQTGIGIFCNLLFQNKIRSEIKLLQSKDIEPNGCERAVDPLSQYILVQIPFSLLSPVLDTSISAKTPLAIKSTKTS
jgi:hypothetical protein